MDDLDTLDAVASGLQQMKAHAGKLCICGGCAHEHHPRCKWKEHDFETGRMNVITVMPIINANAITLLFSGWRVELRRDGTWIFEDTTGG